MKKKSLRRKLLSFQNILIVIIAISIFSCSQKNIESQKDSAEYSENELLDSIIKLDDYKVILGADSIIKKHEIVELTVWIGGKSVNVSERNGMIYDEELISGSIGQYARITPYAPDFDVAPTQKKCIRIHPSGSEVRFSLTPKKSGSLKISANIELFNDVGCTGTPVPKTAKTLTVVVKIDKAYRICEGVKKMAVIFWDKFLSFWGMLITLLFSTLFFLIRRIIKRKTGFDGKKEGE